MALLFIDGCENYVSTSKWTSSNGTVSYSTTDGNANTGSIYFPSGALGINQLYKRVKQSTVYDNTDSPGNVTTRTSFWFKCTEAITTESVFMQWREYYYPDNADVAIGTDGKLKISNWYRVANPANRVYYTTTMSRIDDGSWHYLEFAQFYSNTSSGLIEVYSDGTLALRRTGSNLSASPISNPSLVCDFYIGGLVNGTMYIDDLVIWDDNTTPDSYTGLSGPTKIYTIRPSADTSWANSKPSSGTDRFALINEPQTNFSNLVTSNVNTTDLYTFSPLVADGTIKAVTTSIVFSTDTIGFSTNLKMVMTSDYSTFIKSNTFSSYTSNIANGDTFTSTFINDAWSADLLSSYKIGFEVTR